MGCLPVAGVEQGANPGGGGRGEYQRLLLYRVADGGTRGIVPELGRATIGGALLSTGPGLAEKALRRRLDPAQTGIKALNQGGKGGQKRFEEMNALLQATEALIKQHRVEGAL